MLFMSVYPHNRVLLVSFDHELNLKLFSPQLSKELSGLNMNFPLQVQSTPYYPLNQLDNSKSMFVYFKSRVFYLIWFMCFIFDLMSVFLWRLSFSPCSRRPILGRAACMTPRGPR